ncbi:MAG: hypothetical protein JO180_09970 [Gemmatirosa sp.]|nr:hypothetical protein [Gemmatirosa sp.]
MNSGAAWFAAALFVVGGSLLWLAFGGFGIVADRARRARLREFGQDLRETLPNGELTWQQVANIAMLRGISTADAHLAVQILWRDAVTGRAPEMQAHQATLEHYVTAYRDIEPFEGLPQPTRIHLERLREALRDDVGALQPLTMEIRELASIYERDKQAQRRYTVWGFFVGVFGILLAAIAYFYPHGR